MAKLSAADIYTLAREAGLGPAAATRATAIALAESGGRTDAVGDVGLQNGKWGPSVGLWQIRSLNAERGSGRARDVTQLTDARANARAMVEISNKGTTWKPWSVWTNGKWQQHHRAAEAAAAAYAGGGAPGPGRGAGAGAFPDIGDVLDTAVPGTGAIFDRVPGTDALEGAVDSINPLSGLDLSGALSDAAGDLLEGSGRLMLTGVLVLGGVGLVAAGLVRGVAPITKSVTDAASTAAMLHPAGRATRFHAAGKGAIRPPRRARTPDDVFDPGAAA